MGLGCGASLLKYILFVFNFLFFLTGAGILGISIWLLVDSSAQDYFKIISYDENSNLMEATLILLIVVGAVIFLVGFLGCCGSCKESSCMLCTYAFLLGLVLAAQITGAILAIVFQSDLDQELEKSMQKLVKEDMTVTWDDTYTLAYNSLQYELKCCGAVNFQDYQVSEYYGPINATGTPRMYVPPTCCKLDKYNKDNPTEGVNTNCYTEANTNWNTPEASWNFDQLQPEGCYSKMKEWLDDKAVIVIGAAFGLAAFQILCIVFACCVRSAIKDEDRGYSA